MKRFFLSMVVIFSIWQLIPVFAHAEDLNQNTSALMDYVYDVYGVTMTEARANSVCTAWETRYNYNDNWNLFMVSEQEGYITFIHTNNYSVSNQQANGSFSTITISGSWYSQIYRVSNGSLTGNSDNRTITISGDVYELGDWGSFLINYEIFELDQSIPTPDVSYVYDYLSDEIPVILTLNNYSTGLFVEAYVKFWKPHNIKLDPDGTFSVVTRYESQLYNIIPKQDQITDSTFTSKIDSTTKSNWLTFFTDNAANIYSDNVAFQTSDAFDDLVEYYERYDQIQCLYGNQIQWYIRYFTIEDGNIKVGRWSTWYSKNQKSFTIDLPSWVQPYHNAVGTQNQIVNPDSNYLPSLDPIGGTNTGTDVNIYVNGDNVPNYPDYPTVVTYNHDNIFVQFIETAKQLPAFFGETTDLFSEMFGFIPAWIWGIIGFGFLANIVIMIVKVL